MQELPSYLESRGHPTDFLQELVARKYPDVAEAHERMRRADQFSVIGRQTALAIRNGIKAAAPPRVLLSPHDARKYDPERPQK